MSYQRDFTIGLRETQDFYLTLVIGNWRRGIAGFGLVGALVAWMYLQWAGMDAAWMAPVLLASAAASMLAVTLGLYLVTRQKVRSQLRASGRGSYLQQTEIGGFGVRVTVGGDRARLDFDKLLLVQETKKAFYLFLTKNQAWILPKAQMEDPEAECQQLRALFRTVIESRRLKLRRL